MFGVYIMLFCPYCGAENPPEARFCRKCGKKIKLEAVETVETRPKRDFVITTTPSVPGYKVTKILGIVTGVTARTRGVGGRIIAGVQRMVGGEVSAFTYEMEKARREAVERAVEKAVKLGANALISIDFETSNLFQGVIMISATGTAVVIEPSK